MSSGLVPSGTLRENLFQASVLAPGWLLAVLAIPWLVDTSLHSLLLSSLQLLLCVSLPLLLDGHLSFDLEPIVVQNELISRF